MTKNNRQHIPWWIILPLFFVSSFVGRKVDNLTDINNIWFRAAVAAIFAVSVIYVLQKQTKFTFSELDNEKDAPIEGEVVDDKDKKEDK